MTAIDTVAEAKIVKSGPFWRRRRTMYLYINGENTGLHWGITRKQEKVLPQELVENAAEILEHYGLMELTFAKVAKATAQALPQPVKELVTPDGGTVGTDEPFSRTNMPRTGQRVALTTPIGKFNQGLSGTVTRVDEWVEGYADETQYPVRAAFTVGADTLEIPVHLHEIEAA